MFTTAPELQFHISDPRCKIVQNVKFFFRQSKQWFKLKLKPYLSTQVQGYTQFPKQSLDFKLLQFLVNSDNNAYLEKHDF